METHDEQNEYVIQLKEVFNSCDPNGCGNLDKSGLISLCQRLQLEEQAPFLINRLLRNNAHVNFDDFKDCFVALLAQSTYIEEPENIEINLTRVSSPVEREVSPKYVWGNKKYGRRSRPESDEASDSENEMLSDYSDPEVFCVESSTEKKSTNTRLSPTLEIDGSSVTCRDVPPSYKKRRRTSGDDSITEAKTNSCNSETETKVTSESSCQSNSETESEYLQTIWKKLSVGKDGYLQLEELEKVCQHIGMENISQEVVSQLFAKLDMDQDGRISFQEFLHLFENGEPSTNSSQTSSNSSTPQHVARSWKSTPHNLKSNSKCEEEHCETGVNATSESGMFSSIDPDNEGYVKREVLIDLWDTLGFSNGTQILKDLGFHSAFRIPLQDLSTILEECLNSSDETYLHNVAIATIQHELKYVKNSLDQLRGERNKLRGDVAEANIRAAMLAQEVDDQNAKLEKTSQNKITIIEKKYKEQLQAVQDELCQERDHLTAQVARAQQNMESEISQLRQEECSLKERLTFLQSENERLDIEVRELTHKLNESQRLIHHQQKDLEALAVFRQQMEEIESGRVCLPQDQHETLLMELQSRKLENKSLRDQNDELALQIESLRLQLSARPAAKASSHKRNGSSLGDYVHNSAVKRRGNEQLPLTCNDESGSPVNLRLHKTQHCKTQDNGSNPLDKDLGQDNWTTGMISHQAFDFNEDDVDDETWNGFNEVQNYKGVDANKVAGSVPVMCELKQVFVYLRNQMAAEYDLTELIDEKEEMNKILKDLKEENKKLQKQVKNLSSQEGNVLSHECLMNELNQSKAVLNETRINSVSVTTQTDAYVNPTRCRTLEARLEVAMNELEMSLAREAQGEELLLEFEQKYLQLRERLSDELMSSMNTEMRMEAGDGSFFKFPTSRSLEFENAKVSHVSSDLLECIMENFIRPLEGLDEKAEFDFVVKMFCEFLFKTVDVVKGSSDEFCGARSIDREMYISAANDGCDKLRSWLSLVISDSQIMKEKCQQLPKEIEERDDCLRVAKEEELLWRKKAEAVNERFESENNSLKSYVIDLETKVNELKCSLDRRVGSEDVEVQTEDVQEEELEETVRELKSEKLLLHQACDELQKLKCNLEKEFAVMETELERKVSMQMTTPNEEEACSASNISHVQSKTLLDQFPDGSNNLSEVLLTGQPTVQLTNHSKEKNCLIGMRILHSLNERLRQLERRCLYLEEASKTQALKAEKHQKMAKQQHTEEMTKVKKMLSNTQAMLKQQANDYETQLKASDTLVKQLFVENAELVKALQITEEREKKADQLNVHLHDKCQALSELVANIYKTATS